MKTISHKAYSNLPTKELIVFNGAVKFNDCIQFYENGCLHKDKGPAVISSDGYIGYYIKGKLHRENGPARMWPDGREEYWIHGIHIKNCTSVEALQLYVDMLKLKNIKP